MRRLKPYTVTIEPGDLLSAEDYAHLLPEPGWHTDLTDGRLIRMPLVKSARHNWIVTRLAVALTLHIEAERLGGRITLEQTGYNITREGAPGETVWAPDLGYVSAEWVPLLDQAEARETYPPLAPDLVVEVASMSQFRPELEEKTRRWIEAGTRLVWNVWLDVQTVDVWTPVGLMSILEEGDALDGLDVVPGFSMRVAGRFA
ncbi:MAG TPA: Uma2 family endonuclease [Ktedonobacterales bacterium]